MKYHLEPKYINGYACYYDFDRDGIYIEHLFPYRFIFRRYGVTDTSVTNACNIAKMKVALFVDAVFDRIKEDSQIKANASELRIANIILGEGYPVNTMLGDSVFERLYEASINGRLDELPIRHYFGGRNLFSHIKPIRFTPKK